MPITNLLLLVHAAATLVMVGVIWFVQVVHYPLFDGVGSEGFADYERRHGAQTTWVVMPAMLLELLTAAWLVLQRPAGVPAWMVWGGLALVVFLWAVTFFVSVPQHTKLAGGFDARVHRVLTDTNWLRTAAWSVRGVLALWMVGCVMRGRP
ncbi:MAG: hypothetical protein AAFX76_09920 [Planctomycetota bacterium]